MEVTVSILDNEVNYLKLLEIVLSEHFTLTATHDTNKFFKIVKQPGVLIIDWHLDYGITGLDVMRQVRKDNKLVHCIIISSEATVPVLTSIINEGWGCFFIEKNHSDFFTVLIEKIKRAKELLLQKIEIANAEKEKEKTILEMISKTLKVIDEGNGRSH